MTSATVDAIDIVAWFVYLFSAVLFVVGLHFMNSPKTARKGNQISAFGMVVAVFMAFIVLFAKGFVNIVAVVVLVVGILIGAVAGVVSAKKVKMTDMPQLVSVFNTVGGGAAALVALNDILTKEGTPDIVVLITAGLGILIGSVTFTGSLIAAGKLQGIKWVKKLNLPGKGVWNILFAVLSVVSLVMLCVQPRTASAVVDSDHRVRPVLRLGVRDSDRRRRYARRHLCAQRMHRYGCGYVRSGD